MRHQFCDAVPCQLWPGEEGVDAERSGSAVTTGWLWRDDAIDRSLQVDDVELAGGVFPEGADGEAGGDGTEAGPGRVVVASQAPDFAATVVGKEVGAGERGDGGAAIDVAAGDDAT